MIEFKNSAGYVLSKKKKIVGSYCYTCFTERSNELPDYDNLTEISCYDKDNDGKVGFLCSLCNKTVSSESHEDRSTPNNIVYNFCGLCGGDDFGQEEV